MTSIEWFYNEIKHIIPNDFLNKYEEAKKMHKQNVMNAFNQGHREGWIDGMGLSSDDQDIETFQDAKIYYNETYGSKGSDETKTDNI